MIRPLAPILLLAALAASAQPVPVRGVYSDPRPLWNAGHKLSDLGINAIFVHGGSINQAIYDRATAEGEIGRASCRERV